MELVNSYLEINFYKVNLPGKKCFYIGIATTSFHKNSFELCWKYGSSYGVSTGLLYYWTSKGVTLACRPREYNVIPSS